MSSASRYYDCRFKFSAYKYGGPTKRGTPICELVRVRSPSPKLGNESRVVKAWVFRLRLDHSFQNRAPTSPPGTKMTNAINPNRTNPVFMIMCECRFRAVSFERRFHAILSAKGTQPDKKVRYLMKLV